MTNNHNNGNPFVIIDGGGQAYAIASDFTKAAAKAKQLSGENKGKIFHVCESVYTFYTPTDAEKADKEFWHN